MRILAIETATEACSIALFDQGQLIDAATKCLVAAMLNGSFR